MSKAPQIEVETVPEGRKKPGQKDLLIGALTAYGIVYGDIGTSPLYAFKVAVQAAGGAPQSAAVGIASLILWSLVVVVSVK